MQIGSRSTGGLISIEVTSGGMSYASPPTVTITGGGGTGATAVAHMAGTQVESIVIGNAGTGYTSNPTVVITGGSGAGASATATAYTGGLRPVTFFKSRHGDMYGVDGMGRGFRWDGAATQVEKIGISKPSVSPTVTASTTAVGGYVPSVQIVTGGAGYHSSPSVVFTGGSATTPAKAIATVSGGRVVDIRVTDQGSGYQTHPIVSLTGGIGEGATFTLGVVGGVRSMELVAAGTGYTSNQTTSPTVQFSTGQGLTDAMAVVSVNDLGAIDSVVVSAAGTGATTTGVTATVVGGGGSGAVLKVRMQYAVNSVTVGASGTGYYTAPQITFQAHTADPSGLGAAATASVNTAGNVTAVTVYAGGDYDLPPTAIVRDTTAKAQASVSLPKKGVYRCAIRYIDDTTEQQNGPISSSISALREVDAGGGTGAFVWSFTHAGVEDRVHAMELWRTSSSQSVVLYRVATILRSSAEWSSTYVDVLSDPELMNTGRDGYGLMPITLPSGQINARRFEVPLGNWAVACMFQDRAWYAVDTTGERPNALMYSEIDEPESVPAANELIVQENTSENDAIVALIPLGSELLIAQSAHIYKLNYVAQPVLDASIILGAYRGILNSRCWDVIGGVAFIADSNGLYAYDGSNEDPVSAPVDNYWRDRIIDFSKSDQFHIKCDMATRTVRFYYCTATDSAPVRALCFCVGTKAWWEETYPYAHTASTALMVAGKYGPVIGTDGGFFVRPGGTVDFPGFLTGQPGTPYEYRTGSLSLKDEPSRSVGVLYKPTANDSTLALRLHYNNSQTPRANAVASDRGSGFVTAAGSTAANLNMKKVLPLGEANGFARAYYSGRKDERSAGADRHIAVAIGGTQASTAPGDAVVIYGLSIEGAE